MGGAWEAVVTLGVGRKGGSKLKHSSVHAEVKPRTCYGCREESHLKKECSEGPEGSKTFGGGGKKILYRK